MGGGPAWVWVWVWAWCRACRGALVLAEMNRPQIQNTFQGREHFTAIEGQGLHDTGSGCESRGLEREQLEDRIDGLQLGGGSWGAVDGWQLAVGIGVDDWL